MGRQKPDGAIGTAIALDRFTMLRPITPVSERSQVMILRGLSALEKQVVHTVSVVFADATALAAPVAVKVVAQPGEMMMRCPPTLIRRLKRVA